MARKQAFIVSERRAKDSPKPVFFINRVGILDDQVHFEYFWLEEAIEAGNYEAVLYIPGREPKKKTVIMPALPQGRYEGEPLDLWTN